MQKIIPREWQANIMQQAINSQDKSIIVNAPTGAGKMVFIMLLAQHYMQLNKNIVIMVDRIQLINQLSECANSFGIPHNIMQGKNTLDSGYLITIASVQSYDYTLSPPDVLLIDECHSIYANVSKLIKSVNKVIGLTATAITRGLENVYSQVLNATTAQELNAKSILTPFRVEYMNRINMTNTKLIAGEYSANEIHQRCIELYSYIVQMYQNHTNNKRGIVFCATEQHCIELASVFEHLGIPSGVYTSKTKDNDRIELLRKFDNDEIKLLLSVAALSKGFDKGYIEVIIDLRPLKKSLAEYIQIIGRGLRQYPNKTHCTVLDFSGNWQRFASDYENIYCNGVPKNIEDSNGIMGFNRSRDDSECFTVKCPHCNNNTDFICTFCGWELYQKKVI